MWKKHPRDSPKNAADLPNVPRFFFVFCVLVIIRGSWTQAPESLDVSLMAFAGEVGKSIAATWGAFVTWSREIRTISSPNFGDFYDFVCFCFLSPGSVSMVQ